MNNLIFYSVFFFFSLCLALSDIKYMHIPLRVNYTGIIVFVLCVLLTEPHSIVQISAGAFVLLFIFCIVRMVVKGKLGMGDLHYSIFCGLFCGPVVCFFAIFLSSVLSMCFILFILLLKKQKSDGVNIKIPFVPFMFAGSFIAKSISLIPAAEHLLISFTEGFRTY